MARQPIQDLLGFDEVSQPSASPVDAYSGAPAKPIDAAGQLADALGIAASYGLKGAAQAEAKRDKERMVQSNVDAQNFHDAFDKTKGNLTYEAIRKEYPHADPVVLSNIIQGGTQNHEQTVALNHFHDLDDSVKYNDADMETQVNSLIVQAQEKYKDQPFALAGAIQGIKAARNSTRDEFARGGRDWAIKQHKAVTKGEIKHLFNNVDLNDSKQLATVVTAFEDMNLRHRGDDAVRGSSPLDPTQDKAFYVQTLLEIEENRPGSNASKLIDHVKFLQGGNTPTQVADKAADILESRVSFHKDQEYFKELKAKEAFDLGEMEVNKLVLAEEDADGNPISDEQKLTKLREMKKTYSRSTKELGIANDLMDVVDNAIEGLKVESVISQDILELTEEELVVDASLGEITSLAAMQKAIRETKGLSNPHREILAGKASQLLQGSKLITDAYLKKAFDNRTTNLDGLFSGPQASLDNFQFTKISGGISLEDYFSDIFKKRAKANILLYMKMTGEAPSDVTLQTKYKADGDNGILGVALAEAREAFAFAIENKKMMDELTPKPEPVTTEEVKTEEPGLLDAVVDMFSGEEERKVIRFEDLE